MTRNQLNDTILEDVFAKVRTLLSIWLGSLQLFIPQPDNVHMCYTIQSTNWEQGYLRSSLAPRGGARIRLRGGRYTTFYDSVPVFDCKIEVLNGLVPALRKHQGIASTTQL